MMTVSIDIQDRATPELKGMINKARNITPGLKIAGRAISNLLRAHYRAKQQSEPNKLGGARTNFWRSVRQAVNNPIEAGKDHVQVSISHPAIMQKIRGGTIRAKTAKFLTIPIHREAHGRRASVLARALGVSLFAVTKNGQGVLLGRKPGTNEPYVAYYVLKRSVTQRPDPTALPPSEQIESTALSHFERWMKPRST